MNNYVKLSAATFKKVLKDGRYDTLTGARRAIGKSEMSQEDKAAANKAANAHFGVTDTQTKATAQAKPRSAPAKAKTGRASGRAKRTQKKSGGRSSRASDDARPGHEQEETDATEEQELSQTDSIVQTTAAAMGGLAHAKQADASIDISGAVRIGTGILEKSLSGLNRFIDRVNVKPVPSHLNGTGQPQEAVRPSSEVEDGA